MLQYNDVNNNLGDCKSDKINKDSILSKNIRILLKKYWRKMVTIRTIKVLQSSKNFSLLQMAKMII